MVGLGWCCGLVWIDSIILFRRQYRNNAWNNEITLLETGTYICIYTSTVTAETLSKCQWEKQLTCCENRGKPRETSEERRGTQVTRLPVLFVGAAGTGTAITRGLCKPTVPVLMPNSGRNIPKPPSYPVVSQVLLSKHYWCVFVLILYWTSQGNSSKFRWYSTKKNKSDIRTAVVSYSRRFW